MTQHLLTADLTLNDLATSYVNAVVNDEPLGNPLFESMAILADGRILRISFNVTHKWLTEIPEDAKQALENGPLATAYYEGLGEKDQP